MVNKQKQKQKVSDFLQFEEKEFNSKWGEESSESRIRSIKMSDSGFYISISIDDGVIEFYASVRLNRQIHIQREAIEFVEEIASVFCDVLVGNAEEYREILHGYTVESDDINYTMEFDVQSETLSEEKYF